MSELVQIKASPQQTNLDTRKRKVMLLFPPEWVPTAPYLALPSLTSVLRQAGHQVVQKDVNIEMYDHFFSVDFLIWAKARQGMQLKALESAETSRELSEQEAAQKACLEHFAHVEVFDLAERAERAKGIVRGQAFYEADQLEWALNDRGLTLPHYPASANCATLGGYLAPRGSGTISTKYGKAEDLVMNMEVVLGDGTIIRTPEVPNHASGPDFMRLFLGSEGTFGIITEATIRLVPVETSLMEVDTERTPNLDAVLDRLTASDRRYRYSVAWVDCLATGRSLGRSIGQAKYLQHLAEQ